MRPLASDYPPFYKTYIDLTTDNDVRDLLQRSIPVMEDFLSTIPENLGDFAYSEGKWTVKEVLQHCIDTERIFAYRALCHARGEQQSLPGFEQNSYAALADVQNRTLSGLVQELLLVRQTTLLMFENFTAAGLGREGIVGEKPIKTYCWAFIIAGHWLHHQTVLKEKYLNTLT